MDPHNNSDTVSVPCAERKQTFAQDLLIVLSGTMISQLIFIFSIPVITRLYGPDAFGINTLYISLVTIIGMVSCVMYESAITLPESDDDAANVFALSILLTFCVSIVTFIGIIIGKDFFITLIKAPGLDPYIIYLPLSVCIAGLLLALNNWNIRKKSFSSIGISKVAGSVTTNTTQIATGISGFSSAGYLIFGYIIGNLFTAMVLFYSTLKKYHSLFHNKISLKKIIEGLHRYKVFPIYGTGSEIINVISVLMPVFLLSIYYSESIVGFYSLGYLALQVPVTFIAGAIAQVFFSRAVELHHKKDESLGLLFEQLTRRLFMLGFLPFIILAVAGKEICMVIFGPEWAEAGVFLQILVFWIFLGLITSPLTYLFIIFEKQKFTLLYNSSILMIRLGALVIGGLSGNIYITIILLSAVGTCSYGFAFLWLMKISNSSIHTIIAQFVPYILLGIPVAGIMILTKWILHPAPVFLLVIGIISAIFYYYLSIRDDPEIRNVINDFWRMLVKKPFS
jgi:O-antigen/teichoic acid export membrane protein